MNKWYRNIIEKIQIATEKAVFLMDEQGILNNEEIRKELEKNYEIYSYKTEITLRMKLKKTDMKLIVLISKKQVLPSDFEQNYQIIEIDFEDVFSNLKKQDFENIDIENIEKIYEAYIKLGYFVAPKKFKEIKSTLENQEKSIKEGDQGSNPKLDLIYQEIQKEKQKEKINFIKISQLLGQYCFCSKGEKIYVDKELDFKFSNYIKENFNKLAFNRDFDLSPLNSNILKKFLKIENTDEKKAIICFDCMSFTEWFSIKSYLLNNMKEKITIEEKYSYSFVPSITKYSRKSIFTGKMPIESQDSSEEKGFKKFLSENSSIKKEEIYFRRTGNIIEENFSDYKRVGIIYSFIDDLVHGALNKEMLLKNIEIYLKNSKFLKVIENLIINDFEIYFCSDHGNIQCEGNGVILSKWLVQEKGTRSAIYKEAILAEEIKFEGKEIFNFPSMLEGYIVSDINRKNFRTTDSGISHGGVTLEEMIIPFIKVGKRK